MKGKIHLLGRGFGKIVFDDETETPLMDFPATFEHNDTVEVEFRHGDINDKPMHLIAYSEYYYGFVIKQFTPYNGIFLATYPSLQGTVLYKNQKLKPNQKVRFRIKKSPDGKVEAVDIASAMKEDFYKCTLPLFGKLIIEEKTPKESYIMEVVTTRKDVVSGNIKFVKEEKGFGFIHAENGNDIFFLINQFQKTYEKMPKKGERVTFSFNKTQKGFSVKEFMASAQAKFLPKEKQYGIVDKKKFALQDFQKVYNSQPQEGNIVYYMLKNGQVVFTKNADMVEKQLLFQQKKNSNVTSGKIIVLKKGFGFIAGEKGNIFFLEKTYKNFYKKAPKVGEIVSFSFNKSEKGFQVTKFYNSSETAVSHKAFKNFVEIDSNELYYAYIDGSCVKELYKYNAADLFASISCYKEKEVEKKFKLQAVECLIHEGYTSKNITSVKLHNDKKSLLHQLVDQAVATENFQVALAYEQKLQELEYNPHTLTKFSALTKEHSLFEESEVVIKEVKNDEYLQIIEDIPKQTESIEQNSEFYNTIERVTPKEYKTKNPKWEIIERKIDG